MFFVGKKNLKMLTFFIKITVNTVCTAANKQRKNAIKYSSLLWLYFLFLNCKVYINLELFTSFLEKCYSLAGKDFKHILFSIQVIKLQKLISLPLGNVNTESAIFCIKYCFLSKTWLYVIHLISWANQKIFGYSNCKDSRGEDYLREK